MQIDLSRFRGTCTCGRTHEIFVKDILIEENALKKLPDKIKNIHKGPNSNIVVICDTNTYQAAGKQIEILLPGSEFVILPANGLRADNIGLALAKKGILASNNPKLLIAAGSGTVHEISRYLAKEFSIPFVSVPTAASCDTYASPVSVINWNGFKKVLPGVSPVFILADTLIFAKAPYKLTAAGISAMLGKYTALTDWEISHMVTGEYICNRVCEMEMTALKDVCISINNLKGALQEVGTKETSTKEAGTKEAYEKLMYALLLSGVTMQMIDSSKFEGRMLSQISGLEDMEMSSTSSEVNHGEKFSLGLMMAIHTCHKIKSSIRNGIYKAIPYDGIAYNILEVSSGKKSNRDEIPDTGLVESFELTKEWELDSKRPSIAGVLDKLPSEAELIKLMTAVDCKSKENYGKPQDILAPITLRLVPYIRNRAELIRHSKLFKMKNET